MGREKMLGNLSLKHIQFIFDLYLDRHQVQCDTGDFLNYFYVNNDKVNKVWIEYRCCRPVYP